MASTKKTLYDILGIPRDANSIDVGLAHEKRRKELEQAVPQDPSSLALLHEAYEVLSNPQRRTGYDASLVTAAEKAEAAQQAQMQEPDLVLEGGEDAGGAKKLPWLALGAVAVIVAIALYLGLRGRSAPPLPPVEPVVEAPKPAPPPPPVAKPAAQILTEALPAIARLQSFEMSGRAVPIGLAIAVEPGFMMTTCHGIPAGVQLVANVGAESHSASLALTDEVLDLCKLNVSGMGPRTLAIATDEPKAGDPIFALGANAAGEFALTEGTVKQVRTVPAGKILEISIPIAATASGGAVFDQYGKVVGIGTTPHGFGAGMNVALPAAWIAQARSRGKAQ
jgi:S1-C subfamily serine protease